MLDLHHNNEKPPITTSHLAKQPRQVLNFEYEELHTKYDPIYRAIWCSFRSQSAPVFTTTLLQNIRAMQDEIAAYCFYNQGFLPKYLIWSSDHDHSFSLGLDLKYIYQLILDKNEGALDSYLQLCMDVLYINLRKLDIPRLITISLIKGKTYGGGLEAALSCDIIVSEENARCCFPEVRYNLLPSLGTLKMLLRRYPLAVMQPFLFEGKRFDLNHLMKMGMIAAIAKCGEGIEMIKNKIKKINYQHTLISDLYNAKNNNLLITHDELNEFRKKWVETALTLNTEKLNRLHKFVKALKR